MIGTTAITSLLGFIYWWVAARRFSPEAIGIASASVSAMTLLGNFCMLGLGTLLITELPRQPGRESSLISTALVIVGIVGGVVGLAFAIIVPYVIAGFSPLHTSTTNSITFAIGVSLFSITLVLDQALIGLLRGGLQFWRNTLFAIVKLALLFTIGSWLSVNTGIAIYGTWVVASIVSLLCLLFSMMRRSGGLRRSYLPQWGLLRKLGVAALQHHLLNLTLMFPTLALPIVVTALLSAKMNAWFYVSWMLVSFVFIVPSALTTVLHAMNSAQPATLARKARITMGLAFAAALLANVVLQLSAKQVLGLFGSAYAEQAAWCLRVLVLAAFPLVIKNHYISVCRIQDRITGAMIAMLPGGLLELAAAALGAYIAGLTGLSVGWVVAICIEALFMVHTVYKAVWATNTDTLLSGQHSLLEADAIWLLDTLSMPTIGPSYAAINAIWLMDTISMPIIGPEKQVESGANNHKRHKTQFATLWHNYSKQQRYNINTQK
jgi:O-antigen/teichoic acid export membrane protein